MRNMIQRSLQSHLDGIEGLLLRDEPMHKHTSWRVGGNAELFYVPTDKASLVQLMCQCRVTFRYFGLAWEVIYWYVMPVSPAWWCVHLKAWMI